MTTAKSPRKTAVKKTGVAGLPMNIQEAIAKTDPKTRRFIKETLRLQESGLLGKAFS